MGKVLEVKDLTVGFTKNKKTIPIINDVSFSISPASTLGIVGESGCGKSMTILSIMRLLPSSLHIINGSVYFNGRDIVKVNEQDFSKIRGSQMSMIFQDPMTSLNPTLTIGEQIAESLIIHKNYAKRDALDQAWRLLELVGIPSAKARLNEYPFQLSGGMRQRVMIAIGIATEPKVIFADEPTTALDVTIQAQIMDLLERLRSELNTSIILITHDIGLVAGFAKNILVMYAGRIIEMSEIEELFACPQHPYTKGLLGSLPSPSIQGEELISIPGVVPTPEHFPNGCRFHPRCEFAKEICKASAPPLTSVTPSHQVACWLLCKHE